MRRLRLMAAIAGMVFAVLAFGSPRPAQAEWGAVLPSGCNQGACPTKEAVCQFWGDFYGYWIGDMTPVYNNGILGHYHCTTIYRFNGEAIGVDVYPVCSVGLPDALSPGGCSQFAVSDPKLLGAPACSYCIGMVGNPINGNTGNKVEIVTDYESAGTQKLAFIRTYNSQGRYASSLGIG